MEGASYIPNNPNFPDMWRMKQYPYGFYGEGGAPARSPVDVNINATIPLPPGTDGEWLPFSPCPPHPYKEYQSSMKPDKLMPPQDVADAMLTLKHAVVHPSMCSLMSPVSPSLPQHFTQSLTAPQQTGPSFTYTVGHPQSQFVANAFSPGAFTAQYGDQGTGTQAGQGMFPSMSVNVSMSMNLGVPGQYQSHQLTPQPWAPQQPSPPQYHHGYSPLGNQYTSYPAQSYPSYSLTSEFRSKADMRMYKDRFYGDDSRYPSKSTTFTGFSRAKVMQYRSMSPGIDDPNRVNLCQICGKSYARPSTLKTHMRTHSGEKPYRCGTCHKSFSQAANLTAHMRTHSGEKPFRCPICERRFSQSSSVTTHMRTHSGERPYRCQMCKKAFSDSSTLTKHLRIHSGEKPYQCKLCLLRFSQSGNLNRHMRVHANNST